MKKLLWHECRAFFENAILFVPGVPWGAPWGSLGHLWPLGRAGALRERLGAPLGASGRPMALQGAQGRVRPGLAWERKEHSLERTGSTGKRFCKEPLPQAGKRFYRQTSSVVVCRCLSSSVVVCSRFSSSATKLCKHIPGKGPEMVCRCLSSSVVVCCGRVQNDQ